MDNHEIKKPTLFISHASSDGELAKAVKQEIDEVFANGINIFNSSSSGAIPVGNDWLKDVESGLTAAKAIIVIITPASIKRPWLWFEIGATWLNGRNGDCRIYPLCSPEIKLAELPEPLNRLQALSMSKETDLWQLFEKLIDQFGFGNMTALCELNIIQRIPRYGQTIPFPINNLITWDRLPDFHTQTSNASEICIISPAMATLIHKYPTRIQEIIQSGCNVKILLLHPSDYDALETWRRLQKDKVVNEEQIRNTIKQLQELMLDIEDTSNCEIRFSEVFIPFSMLAVDMRKNDGNSSMNIEFHGYKTRADVRPHLVLTPQDNSFWFKFYVDQFDAAWAAGKFINLSTLESA